MNNPANLYYAKTDEWLKVEGNIGTIGITDYAQEQLSDVVYIEFSVSQGDVVTQGNTFGTIESVKAAADVNLPVSGKVIEVNDSLSDTPELINDDPFGAAWLIKLEISDPTEFSTLMDQAAYEAYCQERHG